MTWVLLLTICAVVNAGLVMGWHGTRGFFLPLLALSVTLLAGLFDARSNRIPNTLTYVAILMGLGLNLMAPLLPKAMVIWLAPAGVGSCLMGFGACAGFALLLPLFPNGLHGGDLKLLAALGAILGIVQVGNALMLGLMVALVYAVINLAARGGLTRVLRVAARQFLEFLYFRRLSFGNELPPTEATHMPMGCPLALGMLVSVCLQLRYTSGGLF